MQERHSDGKRYFRELAYTSEKYLLPFIEGVCPIVPGMRVLEIGCGMGGNLAPFVQRGCRVTGVDLGKDRIENAALMLQAEGNPDIELIAADIFTVNHLQHCFDLVIVHDVIEHIPDKDRFFKSVRDFLKPGGVLFMAFPAWQMPFGGHQQICRSRIISHMPFVHLLPGPLYRSALRACGEPQPRIDEMMDIKSTRTTIEMFERLAHEAGATVIDRRLWLVNPHYETKFGLRPRRLWAAVGSIPWVRNFFTTSCFYIIRFGA